MEKGGWEKRGREREEVVEKERGGDRERGRRGVEGHSG